MRPRFWMVAGGLALASSSYAQGFSAWSGAVTDGSNLSVSANAAMASTSFGMESFVNNQVDKYVFDNTPSDEPRYRVRFYVDTNGFLTGLPGDDKRMRLFLGLDETPSVRRALAIVLVRLGSSGGQYQILVRARRDNGTFANSTFINIPDGVSVVEVDWQRATTPAGTDGVVNIWVNNNTAGSPTATISGIANGGAGVDAGWLGTLNIKSNASGTLYLDEFESRRQTFIGSLP